MVFGVVITACVAVAEGRLFDSRREQPVINKRPKSTRPIGSIAARGLRCP
jgi:hypothetical protein